MVGEVEELIKDVWQNIRSLRFEKLPKRDDKKCKHCDFGAICWPEI